MEPYPFWVFHFEIIEKRSPFLNWSPFCTCGLLFEFREALRETLSQHLFQLFYRLNYQPFLDYALRLYGGGIQQLQIPRFLL